MSAVIYARVSTAEQYLDHQVEQGRAFAASLGLTIRAEVIDVASGVSKPMAEREQGRRLSDILRRGDTLIVRWVDRLGRDYNDVTDTIRGFMRQGVVIRTVISGLVFDGATTDPMQAAVRDAMIAFMSASAAAQAAATKQAQLAGIAGAKLREAEKFRGRKPSFTGAQVTRVVEMHAQGAGATAIAQEVKLSRASVNRIVADPARAAEALERWA